jgi:hypothetical protein
MKLCLTLALFLFAAPAFAQEFQYDRFKDETGLLLAARKVASGPGYQLQLGAVAVSHGSQFKRPSIVTLVFNSVAANWKYNQGARLIVIADSERFDLGPASYMDSKVLTGGISRPAANEQFTVNVPSSDFMRIFKSHKIEMQFSDVEFKLDSSTTKRFSRFAAMLNQ